MKSKALLKDIVAKTRRLEHLNKEITIFKERNKVLERKSEDRAQEFEQ